MINTFNDFPIVDRELTESWMRFQMEGISPSHHSFIVSSWERCKANKINPFHERATRQISDQQLQELKERNQSLLYYGMPYLQDLYDHFRNQEILVVLSNPTGIIVTSKASNSFQKIAERHLMVPGAEWSEKSAGTNAIGTSIIEKKPIKLFSAEHYCKGGHNWVCSASPIFDPFTKEVIGVLNIMGDKNLIEAHNLLLVKTYAHQIQQDIQIQENNLAVQSVFEEVKNPFIIFDKQGKVTQINNLAQYLFNMKVGSHLNQFLTPSQWTEMLQGLSTRKEQEFSMNHKSDCWIIKVRPYYLGGNMLGGIMKLQKQTQNKIIEKNNQVYTRYNVDHIITNNHHMLQLKEKIKKAAYSNSTVIICGETGTGKELIAQSIHTYGLRNDKPFISVNCGTIPKDLVSSELFGYEGGAFSGASKNGKKGKFLLANKGTIFLDEIAELPLEQQVYLLRVIEEREIVPVGGDKPIPIDIRLIAASHKNLKEEVKKGNFREDLYFRLNVISMNIPPLRKRKSDIPLLIDYYLKQNHIAQGIEAMEQPAIDLLTNYLWLGNIRELKNCLEQAAFNSNGIQISLQDLPGDIREYNQEIDSETEQSNRDDVTSVQTAQVQFYLKKNIDKNSLIEVLNFTKGNITKAAEVLNISRMTIYRKIKKYGL